VLGGTAIPADKQKSHMRRAEPKAPRSFEGTPLTRLDQGAGSKGTPRIGSLVFIAMRQRRRPHLELRVGKSAGARPGVHASRVSC